MSALFNCGLCCAIISVWAIIQLALMGVFYKIEATVLIEDVEPHEYADYDDFVKKTKANYSIVAINCWIVAAIYVLMLGLSCACIHKANQTAKKEAALKDDDEYICNIPPATTTKKKKKCCKKKT